LNVTACLSIADHVLPFIASVIKHYVTKQTDFMSIAMSIADVRGFPKSPDLDPEENLWDMVEQRSQSMKVWLTKQQI